MQHRKTRQFTILLIGVTGAGKSTFANRASGQEVKVGYGIDPCTQDPQAVLFQLDNHQIVLIDTPGFDDTQRSDVEILRDVAKWMTEQNLLKNQFVDALILFHPVTRDVVSGDEKRRTQLLKTLLGDDAYNRVTIATTMWSSLDPQYATELEAELTKKNNRLGEDGVWGDFCKKGVTVEKHDNTSASAHDIIRRIISRSCETEKSGRSRQKNTNRNVISFGPSFFKQLVDNLEEDIADFTQSLLSHREGEPDLPFDRAPDAAEEQKWKEWEDERLELEKKLKKRHMHLKQLRGALVSTYLSTCLTPCCETEC